MIYAQKKVFKHHKVCQGPFWLYSYGFCQVAGWLAVSTAIPATCDGWPSGFGYTNAAAIAWSHNGRKRGGPVSKR